MHELPFQTITQLAALGLTLIAGWFLGLASHSGGRKWRERLEEEEIENAGYRDRAESDLRDAARRIRDLEAENSKLRAAAAAAAPPPAAAADDGHSTATVAAAAVAGAAAGAAVTHAAETANHPAPAETGDAPAMAEAEPVSIEPAFVHAEPAQSEVTATGVPHAHTHTDADH